MINIVLADDHQAVRKGLRTLLSTEPGFNVVGEAANGREAVNIVHRQKPDVLVLDLMMPDVSGLEVTRRLSKKCPQTNIVILSMQSDKAYVQEALRCGARGYVLKESPPEEILNAIHTVSGKNYYLSPALSKIELVL